MPTPVLMPQMGESVHEGTIVRWIKQVGAQVERDEPLFEISTDKVDAEIPSPAAGVLTEIMVKEGETVPVNTVVAAIGQADEQPVASTAVGVPVASGVAPAPQRPRDPTPARVEGSASGTSAATSKDELRRLKSSPLVRRIARQHNVDITTVTGSGIGGRVTKQDILGHIARSPGLEARGAAHVERLSQMRKKIAEHMVLSQRTSAHVHSVFHVDFSTVQRIRQEHGAQHERAGAKLSYTAFIASAVVEAISRHPIVNASLDGDNVVYHDEVNLGIAVALDSGLIVPVIPHAGERSVVELNRAIADLADRARSKQLRPDEVHGGTFTITNPGQFGAQFGLPIINQPQVAILGVGTIERRPVVVDDAIAIRTMAYLTLGFDHRLIDGVAADRFMADVKEQIEHFDPTRV